jgi:Fe-S oxidoreductase
LTAKPGGPALAAVVHDSCYLGRWNGETAPMREVLAAIPGVTVAEPPRHGTNGFCCGAGGGRMFMDERIGTPVNANRAAELAATGAAVVATGCPFCATMLGDGLKAGGHAPETRDVAVLLDEATA